MKLKPSEMQLFFDSVNNAQNIVRNDNGQILSFEYMKYYGTTKRTGKLIKVSLKSAKEIEKSCAEYLPEKDFFNLLADNIDCVTNVKLHCEKIYKFTLNGTKYKTDKTDTKKLFDIMEYKDFLKVTRQRFWGNDTTLRNGYFGGLVGTYNHGITEYQRHSEKYDLYDVDFNAAYPYCFKMPLPCDRFYTLEEWEKVKHDFIVSMKFYEIKIKCIKNPFRIFVPPPPFVEYSDFDFLLQKTSAQMVVSEQRLSLIRQIYGNDAFVIKKTYICPVKVYLKLADFVQQIYDAILQAKADNNEVVANQLKIVRNSLIGQFGRRDEAREIKRLKLVDNGFLKDVIAIEWTQPTYKQQPNYLPLAMVINDITARRLFNMLTDPAALRLCYNTDGGIVALRKGCRVVTSNKIGRLKAKRIYAPQFFYTTMLYNRPLIYDSFTRQCYNTKSIIYEEDKQQFKYSETLRLNTRDGFIKFENNFAVAVEPYYNFNLRKEEILLRLNNNPLYKKLLKPKNITDELKRAVHVEAAKSFEQLCNPFDDAYNEVRHHPDGLYYYDPEQITLFNENFFKI